MFPGIYMQIYSVVFALSRQLTSKKYAKTINLLCPSNKVFIKYQAQGVLIPKTPPLRTPLGIIVYGKLCFVLHVQCCGSCMDSKEYST